MFVANKPINWNQPPCETCRIIDKSGKTYGLFYDSKSKLKHIAIYKPYAQLPIISLCGKDNINFGATGSTGQICSHKLSNK